MKKTTKSKTKSATQVLDLIKSLDPCFLRFDNYLRYYEKFNGSYVEFIKLKRITFADKFWVLVRILNKKELVRWGNLMHQEIFPKQSFYHGSLNELDNCRSFVGTMWSQIYWDDKKKALKLCIKAMNEVEKEEQEKKQHQESLQNLVIKVDYVLAG